MKKQDLTLIVVVVIISAIVSFFASSYIFGDPQQDPVTVETAQPITAEFPALDQDFFNENSFNPTQLIRIGDDSNVTPFRQSD